MSQSEFYGVLSLVIYLLGLGLIGLKKERIVALIGMNIMGSGVFMFFITLSARTSPPDPIPHAMVLTGIVVTVAMGMVASALIRALERDAHP